FFVLLTMAFLEQQNLFPERPLSDPLWWSEIMQKAKYMEWWSELWLVYRRVVIWTVQLLLSSLVFLSAGLFSSSVSKNTAAATASAYIITAAICVLSFFPLVAGGRISAETLSLVLSFNPIASALQMANGAFSDYPGMWMNNIKIMIGMIFSFTSLAIARTWWLFRNQE
ncbi:MAG TPA: hypothetical protein PK821_06485, partial [Victivallales bacterium]|nr:hypothetical protein [Victivallales bacterium]